jgi:hypothetical protein
MVVRLVVAVVGKEGERDVGSGEVTCMEAGMVGKDVDSKLTINDHG